MYEFYRNAKSNKKIDLEIEQDLKRADLSNADFSNDWDTGENSLYNVLRAYANYDPEIGYSQGMNIFVSWILKFM
jgi:hypothetical protein